MFSSVHSCPALCNPMNHSTPGLPVHHQLRGSLRLTSIESVMPSSHLILCHPPLLLPPIPPSIRVFSNESTLHMTWPKYWSFSFSISPSNDYSGLISFRMDWLGLHGTPSCTFLTYSPDDVDENLHALRTAANNSSLHYGHHKLFSLTLRCPC